MGKRYLVAGIIILTGGALLAGFMIFRNQPSSQLSYSSNLSASLASGPLDIRIGTDRLQYKHGEKIEFTTTITNNESEAKDYTFNSTCTQGSLYIDNQPTQQSQPCGAALTTVRLKPKERIEHEYVFKLVKEFSYKVTGDYIEFGGELALAPGEHQAYVEWQGTKSEKLSFIIAE